MKKKGKGLKILSPKLMLQRLPIALTQVKAGEKLLNKIRQIIYSFYWEKEITKKVYNKILNSLKLLNRVDTIFMNSKNNKTSDPHRLLLNLIDKIELRRKDKYVTCISKLSIYYTWKNIKSHTKIKKLNISSNMEWRIWITWWIIFCVRYSRLFWVYL